MDGRIDRMKRIVERGFRAEIDADETGRVPDRLLVDYLVDARRILLDHVSKLEGIAEQQGGELGNV